MLPRIQRCEVRSVNLGNLHIKVRLSALNLFLFFDIIMLLWLLLAPSETFGVEKQSEYPINRENLFECLLNYSLVFAFQAYNRIVLLKLVCNLLYDINSSRNLIGPPLLVNQPSNLRNN